MKVYRFFRQNWILVLCAALPFERIPSYNLAIGAHLVTLRISYLVAVAALGLFGWGAAKWLQLNWRSPQFWILVYLFVTILSTFGALSRSRSLLALIATFTVLGTALLIGQFTDKKQLSATYRTIAIITLIVCLFGIYQFLGDGFGLSTTWTGLRNIYTKAVFGFPRIQSTELEPLFLGNFLLIPLLLTGNQLMAGMLKDRKYLYLIGFIAMVLTLTLSRGSFAGAVVAFIVAGILLYRRLSLKATILTILSVASGILAAFGLIAGITRVNQPQTSTTQAVATFTKQSTTVSSSQPGAADGDRVINRRLAIQAFKERPLLGYGIGNFGLYAEHAYPEMYAGTNGKVTVNNEYYEILAETGILGALALLGFALSLAMAVFKSLRRNINLEQRTWIIALTAIATGFAVQYYAFSTLYIMHIWVVLGLLMGISGHVTSKSSSTSTKAN